MTLFWQSASGGLLAGGVYALVALGLTLVFGVMGIINFAQGALLSLAMFLTYFMWDHWGMHPYLTVIITIPVMVAVGVAIQGIVLEPIMKDPTNNQLLMMFGLSLVILNAMQVAWGANLRIVDVAQSTEVWRVGDVTISIGRFVAFAVALLVAGVIWLVLQRTMLGRGLRAVAEQPAAASALGISERAMRIAAFAIAGASIAVAGAIVIPFSYVQPHVGESFALIAFLVTVIGGLGSVPGAIVGGLALGLVQGIGGAYLPGSTRDLALFGIFLVVVAFRPSGIFGKATRLA